jgi:uncharacterized protein (DUF1697 family)
MSIACRSTRGWRRAGADVPRYVAFLRAINVGGRVVKMDVLRQALADDGLAKVETFIASGNVVFDAFGKDTGRLERRIEAALAAALGYRVATFVRTLPQLAAVAASAPFPRAGGGTTVYVGFLKGVPDATATRTLLSLASDVNAFEVHGREVYWLSRGRFGGGAGVTRFDGARLEKIVGMEATLRNVSTVRKLAAKCYDPQ